MSKWSAIYTNASVSSGDGFRWVRVPYTVWVPEGTANPFVEMLYPGESLSPESAIRMYLCRAMTTTFCLGREPGGDGGMMFVIGVRTKKDIFTLKLRFADSTETRVRSYGTQFYVRVIKGDTFSENGDLSNVIIGEAIQ